MYEFFIHLMIITGGVISVILWLVFAAAILVEITDNIRESKKEKHDGTS